MAKYDYNTFMAQDPTSYGHILNSVNQKIDFYEHPVYGDTSVVVCVCDDLKLAEDSTFYETDDMVAEHKEYEPWFKDGVLYIGDSPAD